MVLAAPSQDQSLPRVYPGGNGSAWHGTGLARRRKREHRTVFNNEHLALKEQAARGWFIGTETIDYCAVSQGPFDSIYSFLQIYELPISYKWSPPFLGSWLLASFLSCFFFFCLEDISGLKYINIWHWCINSFFFFSLTVANDSMWECCPRGIFLLVAKPDPLTMAYSSMCVQGCMHWG